jgi:glycosyltransferase involved in cell wall biosynthesis
MSPLHLVVPAGIDDASRPSGGNVYDRRLAGALVELGRPVVEHRVGGAWPRPDEAARRALRRALAAIPDQGTVLVDGLLASASPDVVVPATGRLWLGVLVHLPVGVEDPAARPAEREVLAAARTVVTTSAWTRDWLVAHYGLARAACARPGVDPAPVATGSRTGGALLCVGRACRAKGYDVLAAALASLTDLDWTCRWAGPVDAVDAAAPRAIDLLGPLPRAALAEHYAAADLVVLPSRMETYGMVLTEALARGLPVLASDVGGVREAVGTTPDGRRPGLLVPPDDPQALAAALRSWLTDGRLRDSLRTAALDRRATLTAWAETAARVAAALPEPVGARS